MVKTSWTHLKYAVGDCINMNYLVSDSGWKLNWNSWIYKNSTTNCYIHFTPSVSDFLWLIKLFLSPATCRFGHWKSVSLWHSSVTDWLEALQGGPPVSMCHVKLKESLLSVLECERFSKNYSQVIRICWGLTGL